MDETGWLLALFGSAALLMLAHRQGLRWNVALARATARVLEEVLEPVDQTYTWIGGAIGFHATYALAGGDEVLATATFLPRQSPLYLPFARLLRGPDRLQLTFRPGPSPLAEDDLATLAAIETKDPNELAPPAGARSWYVRTTPRDAAQIASTLARVARRGHGMSADSRDADSGDVTATTRDSDEGTDSVDADSGDDSGPARARTVGTDDSGDG